ncbi:MAG: S-layer homology domain-containing protein [Candidatus Margulisiibacteriota bacterium]
MSNIMTGKILSIIFQSFVICSLVICHSTQALAGISYDPSSPLYSARQLGIGGVSLGYSDDANGVFLNPAGLTKVIFPQLSATSRSLMLNESLYSLVTWAMPTDWGVFGLGYVAENTSGSLPTRLDTATGRIVIDTSREADSYSTSALALSYSKAINRQLSLGGNLKIFKQHLYGGANSDATGTGIDLAALYMPLEWLTVGANLHNVVEGNLQWTNGTTDTIGGLYKIGCKINLLGITGEALRQDNKQGLTAGFDLDIPHNSNLGSNYHLGLEYSPIKNIAIRTGFNQKGLSFGVGVTNSGFRFDYAYASNPDVPGDTPHYFTLSYVGERTVAVKQKLNRKEGSLGFIYPKDKYITNKDNLVLSAEAKALRIIDQTTIWTVTSLSSTQETHEITKEEKLVTVSINGKLMPESKTGIISEPVSLNLGRNIFRMVGFTEPEQNPDKTVLPATMISSEVRVLKFTPYSDLSMESWALEPIALTSTLGLVTGYPNNTFKPEKGITRVELITLLVRSLPLSAEALSFVTPFKDVPAHHWAAEYVAYGSQNNIVTGYPDKTFKPKNVLSRAEGVAVLVRFSGITVEAFPTIEASSTSEEVRAMLPFPDLNPKLWANKYISAAKKAGFLNYLSGKHFKAAKPFTREEACEILYKTPMVSQRVNDYWETGIVTNPQSSTHEAISPPVNSSSTFESR